MKKSLLDDEAPPLPDEPVDLSKTLHQIVTPTVEKSPKTDETDIKSDILAEFDVINKVVEDEDDQEFALLAAESLSKSPTPIPVQPLPATAEVVKVVDGDWKPFGEE